LVQTVPPEITQSVTDLVEGDGRHSHKEALHFFYIARGSLRETRLWITRAMRRRLVDAEKGQDWLNRLAKLLPTINSLISKRREWLMNPRTVHEEQAPYVPIPDDSIA